MFFEIVILILKFNNMKKHDLIHKLLSEKIEDKEMKNNKAICIKGKNKCPPEYYGGYQVIMP